MSEDAVAKYQKESITGHRPTWKMGSLGGKPAAKRSRGQFREADRPADDPFSLFGEMGTRRTGHAKTAPEGRKILNAQRRALDALGLETDAKRADIKARFKMLVKRHHPDANGGDRGSEARLREIIQAYNYLKTVGFC
jgi:DnaJ-domain-containing protein 1